MRIGDIAAAIGKGLVAGAAGTVVMTGSQMLAQGLLGEESSDAPVQAVEKVAGVEPKGEKEKERVNYATHFVYGTAWGVPRGLLGLTGIPSAVATAALFAGVQGRAMTMMPALDIAPPPTEWDARELAVDAFHHVVYAVTVGLVFGFLDRRSAQARER